MEVKAAKAEVLAEQNLFTVNQQAKAKNLAGGVLAWSDKIDPKMPKY